MIGFRIAVIASPVKLANHDSSGKARSFDPVLNCAKNSDQAPLKKGNRMHEPFGIDLCTKIISQATEETKSAMELPWIG